MNPNAPKWKQQKPWQEVWYVTLNDARKRGFWFRYTLLNLKEKTALPEATVWAFVFDPSTAEVLKFKKTFKAKEFSSQSDLFLLHFGKDNQFFENRLSGNIEGQISWDLVFKKNPGAVHLVPQWIRTLPFVKTHYVVSNQDIIFSGIVSWGKNCSEIKDAAGTQAHIWGTRHAYAWRWVHCNAFQQKGYSLEIISVKINRFFPYMTFGYFKTPKREFYFRNPLLNSSEQQDGKFLFSSTSTEAKLNIEVFLNPKALIDVAYTRTNGTPFHCLNTETGNLRVHFKERDCSETELVSEGTTHFEYIVPEVQCTNCS